MLLADLLEELPEDLARQVFTHASWSERRGDSYTRLAFLGDSVLGLAVTTHLYPRLEAERFGAGRLTKIRAQAVSGVSCRAVAERLGLPRASAGGGAGERPRQCRRAASDRARAGLGDRGGDRGLLSARRIRADRRGGGGGLRAGDRGCAQQSGRLQVGAAGAPGTPWRGGQLRGGGRARAAARAVSTRWWLGSTARSSARGSGRSKKHAEQEAAQARRRAAGRRVSSLVGTVSACA